MSRCGHRRVCARIWSEGGDGQWMTMLGHDERQPHAHARICADCGAWLSLGPAQDSGRHAAAVAVEIRAAELAQFLRDGHAANKHKRAGLFYSTLDFNGAEAAGHIEWAIDSAKVPEQDGEWSGWLCGYIAQKEST